MNNATQGIVKSCLFAMVTAMAALITSAPVALSQVQDLTALARLVPDESGASEQDGTLRIDLTLSQPVPYRVFTLADPWRLVLDFREVDWRGLERERFFNDAPIRALNAGVFLPGWSRLVVELAEPMALETAGMMTDLAAGQARVSLALDPTSEAEFRTRSGAPPGALWSEPQIATAPDPIRRQTGDRPLVIALDPGHGGIDPGAEHSDLREAELMLTFAFDLRDLLIRSGFQVVLTRESDSFVPLETRVSLARAARADVFLSLHADALSEGDATGATVYTLSDTASDQASALLAQRHDRADLLAGVDLSQQGDVIATVLMDLARIETEPRSDRLADALVEGLSGALGRMYKHPRQTAGFSVLKAPDIPSVLIELGFLSNERDREDLVSPEWRASAARGIVEALNLWAIADAAEAQLIRQ